MSPMPGVSLHLEWLTVGVLRCVFESTISKKSLAVGTGAIGLIPLVAIFKRVEVKSEMHKVKLKIYNM